MDINSDFPKLNVLLIDDDYNSRDILSRFLGELGFENIHQTKTAVEALEFIDTREDWKGLVLCDWNMPQMTGASFYQKLKKKKPNLPFIMISARNDEDSIMFARDNGISAYILKPVPLEELERKIRTVVTNYGMITAVN